MGFCEDAIARFHARHPQRARDGVGDDGAGQDLLGQRHGARAVRGCRDIHFARQASLVEGE